MQFFPSRAYSKSMKVISEEPVKVRKGEELPGKCWPFAYVGGKRTHQSPTLRKPPRYEPLSGRNSSQSVWYIPTSIGPKILWISPNVNMVGQIIPNSLEIDTIIITGIENFGNQAKQPLRKYNSIPAKYLSLFLKEGKFRCNYGFPKQQERTMRRMVQLLI